MSFEVIPEETSSRHAPENGDFGQVLRLQINERLKIK
jgi:hypothetical protein